MFVKYLQSPSSKSATSSTAQRCWILSDLQKPQRAQFSFCKALKEFGFVVCFSQLLLQAFNYNGSPLWRDLKSMLLFQSFFSFLPFGLTNGLSDCCFTSLNMQNENMASVCIVCSTWPFTDIRKERSSQWCTPGLRFVTWQITSFPACQ